jgi:SAM-dependent methyltransferase
VDTELYDRFFDTEDRHWWFVGRRRLVTDLLTRTQARGRILDLGCGTGGVLAHLGEFGTALGLDPAPEAAHYCRRRDLPMVIGSGMDLPFAPASFDAVLALDVIEHLDDDREAVRRLGSLLEPGGVLVVSVPALPAMFSEFDAVQGHRRRYLPGTLAEAFEGSGLRLDRTFWWGRWLVPLLGRRRARTRSRPGETPADVYRRHLALPHPAVSRLLSLAFRLEQGPALRGVLRSGTSLFAAARRP